MTDVLTFWFGSPDLRAPSAPELRQRWFAGGPAFDREIVARFGDLLDAPDEVEAWATLPAGALAAVVVLDQFSRNAFRGTARAFATDARAFGIASQAIDTGWDRELGTAQRAFLYMPYEHAEDPARQERAVALFTALAAEDESARGYLPFAEKHREIVARFGRFPGRNRALGRAPTEAEIAWLAAGGDTFGQ